MKTLLWLTLSCALLLLAGCPVEDEAPPPQSSQSSRPVATDNNAQDAPITPVTPVETVEPLENPCGDENPCAEAVEGEANPCAETDTDAAAVADDAIVVVMETSKGVIEIAIHSEWAPIGAAHFLELIEAGYYDGAPWFRVVPGFICQAGLAADPTVTAKWQPQTIQDEPVLHGNLRGTVTFAKSAMPNSRSTQFFINYQDNSMLDGQGFSAFGEVTKGMDVAEALYATGDNAGSGIQAELSQKGIAEFYRVYPEGDVIKSAYIK